MKRNKICLLKFVILLALVLLGCEEEEELLGENYINDSLFEVNIYNGELIIVRFKEENEMPYDIIFPDKINEISVTSIARGFLTIGTFGERKTFGSVVIPSLIKNIGRNNFNFDTIDIGDDVLIEKQRRNGKGNAPRSNFESFRRYYDSNGKKAGTYELKQTFFGSDWIKK
jgi:hypothetical protein